MSDSVDAPSEDLSVREMISLGGGVFLLLGVLFVAINPSGIGWLFVLVGGALAHDLWLPSVRRALREWSSRRAQARDLQSATLASIAPQTDLEDDAKRRVHAAQQRAAEAERRAAVATNAAAIASAERLRAPIASQLPDEEKTIGTYYPSMFGANPPGFLLLLAAVILGPLASKLTPNAGFGGFAVGAGAFAILLVWWLRMRATSLVVTTKRITLRRGLLSKETSEMRHKDVRNVKVSQTFGQRLMDVGDLAISSAAAHEAEVHISGVKSPRKLVETVRKFQE